MAEEIKFPKGIFFNPKREGSPDFVRGGISIKVAEAIPFLKENANESGYVNLDILKSKEGKTYLKVNQYKKSKPLSPEEKATIEHAKDAERDTEQRKESTEIPF